MFGYVVIHKPEMKFREFDLYRSYYCGLCRELKRNYGIKGQMTLNYDMTFLTILLSGLYDSDTKKDECRCVAHPFEKHETRINEFTEYAADMNIVLSYYQCMDDWNDSRKVGKRMFAGLIKGAALRVEKKYPEKVSKIKEELGKLGEYERKNSTDIDAVSGCFGRLMAVICAYKKDEWEEYLNRIGFYLGKYIYLLDAFEDYAEDVKKERYNPLGERAKDKEYCQSLLTMMMAECSAAFEMLPIVENLEILQNILYAGVWTRFMNKTGLESKKDD